MSKLPAYKTISVDKLIPYARNSRKHSDEQITKIAASIKEFSFLNPVIIDGENGIIAGHGRVMAAKKIGLETVPVIEASHLTYAQRRAYVIADNRLAEVGSEWDEEMLRVEFAELGDLGFDLELTGFEMDEIDSINLEPIDIEDVDHFNTSFNFSITCDDPAQLALVQSTLGVTGKKIDASKLLEMLR